MARPALLIGLGGTGQWVLTYVKKELLDYTKGEDVPKEVRLVAFDTTRPIDKTKKKSKDEEPVVVEGVQLDTDEYYHLGGNIERIVREIAEKNQHPHIGSWLQAKTYLGRLGAGQYMLEEGAGQMRPFGRMAVFKDLESNPERSTIFGTLRDAIQDIRREVKENRSLEVSIVASLAGGTGAGMAVDVAHLVRTIAEDAIGTKNFVIRGFFVLPKAFHLVPNGDSSEMRARAFAAVRELSRFITVFGDREYPMIYNPHSQFRNSFQRPVKKRLFDLCYLVDAHRERNSLDDVEPKFGIFPSIADAMLAFVDERSGQEHTEHVNNIMAKQNNSDQKAFFSSIGTYAFDLPIREIAEENACKLAIDFLNKIVKPEFDEKGRVIRLSAIQNNEMDGKHGGDLVKIFMEEPGSVPGMTHSLFLSRAAKDLGEGGVRNNQILEQAAERSNMDWLGFIEPTDTSEDTRDLRADVREIIEQRLRGVVKSSKEIKEKPEFGCDRIEKEVEEFMVKYLGRKQPDGSTAGGEFRGKLENYVTLQIDGFKKGLANYCLTLLNGTSETDQELSKSGKLGFVQAFVNELSREIEKFCKFLERVGEIRQNQGRLQFQRDEVQQARNRMHDDRKKSGLFQNRADDSQKQYLQLMEDLVELEKDQMLFDYVGQIARQYRSHSLELLKALENWGNVLAVGSTEYPGLYESLNTSLEYIKAKRRRSDNFSRVRHEETDKDFERELYKRFAENELVNMFRSIKWSIDEDGESFNLEMVGEVMLDEKKRERDRPMEHNINVLLQNTRNAFHRVIKEETIGKRLREQYDAEDLGQRMFENGGPLVNFIKEPPFVLTSNFLAVKYGGSEGEEKYFRRVVKEIGDLSGAKGDNAKLVQSEGTHKCTLIYTRDIIDADCLSTYEELESAYRHFTDDRRLLHNFPAEVNAVHYEDEVRKRLGLAYRLFHPRIVFMLEYKDWVKQFTRCRVHDLVKINRDKAGNQFWALHLPKCDYEGKKFRELVVELTPHVDHKAEVLDAMDTFVFKRKDCRKEYDIPIIPEHLEKALILAEETVGKTAENAVEEGGEALTQNAANIRKIQETIDKGFVCKFKDSEEQFERDLGDLMHVMLLDEIDRLS